MASASPATLLLCIGNALRGDDGVAHRVGEAVEDLRLPALTIVLTHQLLPEHAYLLSESDSVIFLDCSVDTTPGAVTTLPLNSAAELPRILTHHLGPDSLLRMAADLYQRTPAHATLITIGAASLDLGEQLSPTVEQAIPAAIAAIRAALNV